MNDINESIKIVRGDNSRGAEFLREVITSKAPIEWIYVLGAMSKMANEPLTPEGEALLHDILAFNGEIILTHMGDGPHSRPPKEMLHQFATMMLENNK